MAVLLKENNTHTIAGEIKRYVMKNGYYLFASVFCCVLIITFVFYRYFRDNRQQAAFHAFYESIGEMDDYFYSYAISLSDAEYKTCKEQNSRTKANFEKVARLFDDRVYLRESRDIGNMLELAGKNLETVQRKFRTDGIRTLAYELYLENHKILELTEKTYQNMYQRFLFLTEQNFNRLAGQVMLFFLIYFLFLSVEFLIWLRRADELAVSLAAPIQRFTERIKETDGKDFGREKQSSLPEDTYEELRVWEHVYYEMMQIISEHQQEREEYYKGKIELQKRTVENLRISKRLETLRYKTLQAQINPHFLFNTMNMMMQSAYLNEDMETAELLECTSDLLRYGLDFLNHAVTLQEEVEALDYYLRIQEKRFGDRIKFILDLDEAFHSVKIPNLILQPLVENSISHGLGTQMEQGVICIQTRGDRTERQCILCVRDNGCGMSKERLEEVLFGIYEEEEHENAIGLHNLYQRLNIFFGGSVFFEIESEEGKGTAVTIKIPWEAGKIMEGEERNVPDINCG